MIDLEKALETCRVAKENICQPYEQAHIAGRVALLLMISSALWIAGTVVIVATIILLIIEKSALEKWCDSCCYSLNYAAKRYSNIESELEAFLGAVEGEM